MKKQQSSFGRVIIGLGVIALTSVLLSGCASFRAWGEKSSSTPATFGGGMSIPLGKK